MWAKETEQSEQLQEMIDQTLAELQALARPTGLLGWLGRLGRLLTGGRKRKLAELQLLTAAYNNLQAAPTKRASLGATPPQLPTPRPDRE